MSTSPGPDTASSIARLMENGRIDEALTMGSAILHNSRRNEYIGSDDAVDLYDRMVGASSSLERLEGFWDTVQEEYTGPVIIDPAYEEGGSSHPDLDPEPETVPEDMGADDDTYDDDTDTGPADAGAGPDRGDEPATETGDEPVGDYDVEFRLMEDGIYEGMFGYLGELAGLPASDTTELEYGISVSGADLDDLVDELAGIRVVGGEYDIRAGDGEEARFYRNDDGYIRSLENMEVASFDVTDAASFVDEDDAYFGTEQDGEVSILQADETEDEVVYSGSALDSLPYNSTDDFAYNIQLVGQDGEVMGESGWSDGFEEVEFYDDEDAVEAIEEAYGDLNVFVPGETVGLRNATRQVLGKYKDWGKRALGYGEDRPEDGD